jgi:hypothetical protein
MNLVIADHTKDGVYRLRLVYVQFMRKKSTRAQYSWEQFGVEYYTLYKRGGICAETNANPKDGTPDNTIRESNTTSKNNNR